MKEVAIAGAVLMLTLSGAAMPVQAHAQQSQQAGQPAIDPVSVLVEVRGRDDQIVPRFNVPLERLRGMDVYGAQGEEIGEIEEVLATGDGRLAAVAIDVGGFLGVRERQVIVNLHEIELDGLRLVINATRESIEALPRWGS